MAIALYINDVLRDDLHVNHVRASYLAPWEAELHYQGRHDAALDVGRVRFRAGGSPGGHRGLESVSEALDTNEYARLRVGVGQTPGGIDLSDWVLAPLGAEDEDEIHGLLPHLVQGVRVWMDEGIGAAMSRFNR